MSYCTVQDLLARGWETELIQLTDKQGVGVVDTVAVEQAIADATATIDSYISRFLPLPVGYKGMVRIACDLSRYFLYDNRVTEQVQSRYDAAIRYLEKVAKGEILLGVDGNDEPVNTPGMAAFESSPRLFGRGK
jgi:phage gp36-like protein